MAVRPLAKLALIFLVIFAWIALIIGARSRLLSYRKSQENRFISTYLAMSVAREKYVNNPDSLRASSQAIFDKNETDSVWMVDYGRKLSIDLVRGERIWATIISKLDSLKKTPDPESLLLTRQNQP
jgi:hypothetical protein